MADHGNPTPVTAERLMRRIWDGQQTIARLRTKIANDPTSGKVPQRERRIAELDVAVQLWKATLERMSS